MKLNIGNKAAMTVKAVKTTASKKPQAAKGGDLRAKPGNR